MPKFSNEAQARLYIYRIVDLMLEHEETDPEGWVYGGMDHGSDRRFAALAIKKVRAEMQRKYEQ